MSVSLEETIAKLDEAKKRGLLGVCGIKINYILKLLRELQERRKSDNEIPFGDSHSFTELDSIINAYEVHGGYHKKVVELLKELRERRKQPEIIRCKDCENWDTTWQNDFAPNYHYCPMIDGSYRGDFYCGKSERRTDV